jgi:hypothetical protein
VLTSLDEWTKRLTDFVARKGKVTPGAHRAYGYEPPSHRIADAKLKWRALRMSAGMAQKGSSPAQQERAGLNRDATFTPERGEGEKLRQGNR